MASLNSGTSSVIIFLAPSPSQRAGDTVVAVFALTSTLVLVFVAFRVIRIAVTKLQGDNSTSRPSETLLFRTQLGHYIGCLMLGNLFISLAGLINFNWVSPSGLTQGSACSAQAALMEIGIWSTCWFTVALGVNNLNSFVFRAPQTRWHTLAVVSVGWVIALVVGLAPVQAYGPVGSSCAVMQPYPTNIFALQALPIILTIIVSIVVYCVIFLILHEQLCLQQTGGSKAKRREGKLDEQHGIVRTIIWTLFWFPFAFVLLLLPYSIVHIIMATGQSIPFASSVFADVCVTMLGLVNVGLLFNTLRVIGPVYRSRSEKDAAADETFGNDASYESPISPQESFASRPPVMPPENAPRMHNGIQEPSSHSRDSSWSSVNSNTELLDAEKASVRTKSASRRSLWLSQQPSDPRPSSASKSSYSSRPPSQAKDDQDPRWSSQSMADTDASRKSGRELTFKAKAPPALNLPQPMDSTQLHSGRDIINKSATLAARLGIPVASARTPRSGAVGQGNEGGSVTPTISRIVNPWSPDHREQPHSNPSPSFTISLDSDCESDDTGEITHIKPLPQVPESDDGDRIVVEPFRTSGTPWMQARTQRATMVSVWSQESSRYTLTQSPDEEAQEAYRQLMGLTSPPKEVGKAAKTVGPRSRQPSFKASTKLCSQVVAEPHHEHNDSSV